VREKQHAKSLKPFLALRSNYKKGIKPLINATEKKSAARLFSELKRTTAETLLRNRQLPDDVRLSPIRKRFRNDFLKNFSKAKEIQKFRKQYFSDLVKEGESFLTGFVINSIYWILSRAISLSKVISRALVPPYEFGEINNTFEQHANRGDHAILDLATGFVSIQSHYETEVTPVFDWFDAPSLLLKSFNGVGATYTMPKTGNT
jgi:hypothetical protein